MLPPTRFSNLDVNGAARLLDAFTIVDVRQPDELLGELGYIRGSHNVPLHDVLEAELPATIERDRPLLVVCRSGARSARAADALAARGFSRVHNLSGGMIAWNASGLPTSRATG
jgi:rhodanese-related sulfurtransferase